MTTRQMQLVFLLGEFKAKAPIATRRVSVRTSDGSSNTDAWSPESKTLPVHVSFPESHVTESLNCLKTYLLKSLVVIKINNFESLNGIGTFQPLCFSIFLLCHTFPLLSLFDSGTLIQIAFPFSPQLSAVSENIRYSLFNQI